MKDPSHYPGKNWAGMCHTMTTGGSHRLGPSPATRPLQIRRQSVFYVAGPKGSGRKASTSVCGPKPEYPEGLRSFGVFYRLWTASWLS